MVGEIRSRILYNGKGKEVALMRYYKKNKVLYMTTKKRYDKAKELEALLEKHKQFAEENKDLKEVIDRRKRCYERGLKMLRRRVREAWLKSSRRYSIRVVPGANVAKATFRRDGQ